MNKINMKNTLIFTVILLYFSQIQAQSSWEDANIECAIAQDYIALIPPGWNNKGWYPRSTMINLKLRGDGTFGYTTEYDPFSQTMVSVEGEWRLSGWSISLRPTSTSPYGSGAYTIESLRNVVFLDCNTIEINGNALSKRRPDNWQLDYINESVREYRKRKLELKRREEQLAIERKKREEEREIAIQKQIPILSAQLDSLYKNYLNRLVHINELKNNLINFKEPEKRIDQFKISTNYNDWNQEIEGVYDQARSLGIEIDKTFKELNINAYWYLLFKKIEIDKEVNSLFKLPIDDSLLLEFDKIIKQIDKVNSVAKIDSLIDLERARIKEILNYEIVNRFDEIESQVVELNRRGINQNGKLNLVEFSNKGAFFNRNALLSKIKPTRDRLRDLSLELAIYKNDLTLLKEILFIYGFTRTNYYYLSLFEASATPYSNVEPPKKDKRYKKIENAIRKSGKSRAFYRLSVDMWNLVSELKNGRLPSGSKFQEIRNRKDLILEYSYIIRSSFKNNIEFAPISFNEAAFVGKYLNK